MRSVTLNFKLLVGLGNPSPDYQNTRHNAGFWFADLIASQYRLVFSREGRYQGLVAKLNVGEGVMYLLKPLTFMNRSGESVAAIASFLRLEPRQILVVHDELDLAPGVVRLKCGGGHGGHNGVRDVIAHLGASDFYRLRVGIGHPGDRSVVVRYVLNAPSRGEEEQIRGAMARALAAVPELLGGSLDLVMNRLHTSADCVKY